MSGWVKLHRSLLDNGLLCHPEANAVFIWLLLNAAWKDKSYATRYGVIHLKPGEVIVGRMKLAKELDQSEQNIRTALKLLSDMKIITIEITNRYSRITLVNWEKYQSVEDEVTSTSTSNQPAANQQLTTDKEGNKENKEKKEPEGFLLFWNLYSKKTTKAEALDYWTRKLRPTPELQALLLAGLTLENQARAAAESKGLFFPAPLDPIRWLKKRRWEDQHGTPGQPASAAGACQHPHEKVNWQPPYGDGMQFGYCSLCKMPTNRMVEPPTREEGGENE